MPMKNNSKIIHEPNPDSCHPNHPHEYSASSLTDTAMPKNKTSNWLTKIISFKGQKKWFCLCGGSFLLCKSFFWCPEFWNCKLYTVEKMKYHAEHIHHLWKSFWRRNNPSLYAGTPPMPNLNKTTGWSENNLIFVALIWMKQLWM